MDYSKIENMTDEEFDQVNIVDIDNLLEKNNDLENEDFIEKLYTKKMITKIIQILCVAVKSNRSNIVDIFSKYTLDTETYNLLLIIRSVCSTHQDDKDNNNKIICKLIENGADIFTKNINHRNMNLLHFNALGNNTFIIKYVLEIVKEKYSDKFDEFLNELDSEQCTPLVRATQNNSEDAVELLLKYGAHIHLCDEQKRSPIWIAASSGNIKLVKLLVENGANVNQCSFSGKSPLFMALLNKSIDVANFILENGGVKNAPKIPLKKDINFNKLFNNDETFIIWIKQSFDSIESYENPNEIWEKIAFYMIDPYNSKSEPNPVTYISKYRDPLHSGSSFGMVCNKIYYIAVNGIPQECILS
jgi:hypothetical protein